MRVLGVILAVVWLLPVSASDLVDPGSLKGKHKDEIIAAWGPPTKIKRHHKENEVLVYRLVIPLGRLVDAGTVTVPGASGDPVGLEPSEVTLGEQKGGRVKGRARLKLYLDQNGYVVKVKQRGMKIP